PIAPPSLTEKKAKAADIIARARAKREAQAQAPHEEGLAAKKARAAEILERARRKRQAAESRQPVPAPARRSSSPSGRTHSRAGTTAAGATKRPGAEGRRGAPSRLAPGPRRPRPPKKSRTPLWIGLGVLVIGGGGALLWFASQGGSQEAAPAVPLGTKAAAPSSELAPVSEAAPAAAEAAAQETPSPAGTQEESPAAEAAATPAREKEPGTDSKAILTRGITDFDALDLQAAPTLEKWSGTTDEGWAAIRKDVELFLEDNGVFSTRAGDRLVGIGRGAFPALVNAMMKLDYKDPDQVRMAGILNTTIGRMSKGKGFNFGWKSVATLEPGSEEYLKLALFDKKIAANWYNSWITRLASDDVQWANFIGETAKKKTEDSTQPPPPVSTGGDLFDD
ncbi:MAG: hypothetical protein ACE5H3_04565, partial [Planctomycetota bacterium]